MENNLKQEMMDLGNEFVEFWRKFLETVKEIPSDDTEKLISSWHEHFVNNNKTTLKLIEVKLKVEEIDGIESK